MGAERSPRGRDLALNLVAIERTNSFGLEGADPLPEGLQAAGDLVARDFELPTDWLNPGPTSLLDLGLPAGFVDRLERKDFGGPGKHEQDLRRLDPTEAELIAAARWNCTHDISSAHAEIVGRALEHFGVTDVDLST